MTSEQSLALDRLMQLVSSLSNLTQTQARMIEELLKDNEKLAAEVESLRLIFRTKV